MKRRQFLKSTAAGGLAVTLAPILTNSSHGALVGPRSRPGFNTGWRFRLGEPKSGGATAGPYADWEEVTLPHTAQLESLVTGEAGSDTYQWQGVCSYRKRFVVGPEVAGKHVMLKFDGAMNVADVWLNDEHLGRHLGGFLPFAFDVSSRIVYGGENVLTVRLDNTDNPVTGPKPLSQLDFNLYHGIYRDVHLVVKDALHITDEILAERPAGGGVFVRFPEVSHDAATVWTQVHVRNADVVPRRCTVRVGLADSAGRVVADATSESVRLAPGDDADVVCLLRVASPALWSPMEPHLHTLGAQVVSDGQVVDAESIRIGIRRIEISEKGFSINGQSMFLRGTNRHQEYPYVGYAVPSDAQYRDARKIKDAGFDYVRLSHYPHAPAFMDACDELGLVVMDCIPGWQYFNADDKQFAELQYENCRRMIRRDRNHACVILWEVSLNETSMPPDFIAKTQDIGHEEYPGDQCFTCGWTEGYDVFIQARQHGGCTEVEDVPCLVSEYGDWEYYAQNAGLNQDTWADLSPDEANSRQLRWHGERALLQQATNFQEAHNDNRKTIAFADGLWVMFDYNRGYAPDIESSGCMDLFRLPKFSYYFYQSQRAPRTLDIACVSGPMVFIASYWAPESPTTVRVFSNCDEVELHLNGRSLARRRPDSGRLSTYVKHPPFTFAIDTFEAGTLEAIGFIEGRAAARHAVRTPGEARGLDLRVDESGRGIAQSGKDVLFAHATLKDGFGTVCSEAWENVFFGALGNVELVGNNPSSSEAGVSSTLIQTQGCPDGSLYALAVVRQAAGTVVLSGAAAAGGGVQPFDVRYTVDGSEPGPNSVRYSRALETSERVRAALFVRSQALVHADTDVSKYRIAGSASPEVEN